ncbi:MAG: hypothetical protein HY890_02830 [Deltaproteobacteria bacterium]|nr:hypothetical protein [Deltaproteobacteria bacterium]
MLAYFSNYWSLGFWPENFWAGALASPQPGIELFSWGLFDANGDPVSGASAYTSLKIRRKSDGFLLDWSDNTFKSSSWGSLPAQLDEGDPVILPGIYGKTGDVTGWTDGYYQAIGRYSGLGKQNKISEFYVKGGQMVPLTV